MSLAQDVRFSFRGLAKSPGFLFAVAPTDPLTFGGVALVVVGVVAAACARPARRAMAVDPATVLRSESHA